MLAERVLAAQRLAVQADTAALGLALVAGLDLAGPEMPLERAPSRQGAAALAVDLGELDAAQAAARAEHRDRLEQVGLAGAVLAVEHDRARRAGSSAASR